MQSTIKRALVLGALATFGMSGVAQAATDDTSVAVTGGAASMTAPTFDDFAGVTLTGQSQSQSTAVSSWSVNDARGTGAGWEVTMGATALTAPGSVTMAGAALTLTAPAVAATDVTNVSAAPAVLGGNLVGGTVKVADADSPNGMGAWSFTQGSNHLALAVPANAKAGTYTSTITTTLTPGL